MKKQLQISGTFRLDNKTESFTGIMTFDEKENSIYHSWSLFDRDGKSIGSKSFNVAFPQIPVGQGKFEFSETHAIEGIRFRIGRDKIIQELNVDWKK